ncbi:unnamed protein product [Arabis nemorensis]|uniref:Peptidase C1A papain C-terminal domain-containing protein n=1 Tax=Arabis nemorensis TaxID=586526 RepID=A0A565B5J1_9BRAS|nr:unnamed protein product [Arabis nemorensis]
MYSASIGGGKGKRQNQVKQAKEYAEAMKKKNEAESSSGTLPNKLTFQEGVYYLPKKMVITKETGLHCIILIGYGETKDGKLYFIGQNSHGDTWGCMQRLLPNLYQRKICDIICTKEQI